MLLIYIYNYYFLTTVEASPSNDYADRYFYVDNINLLFVLLKSKV